MNKKTDDIIKTCLDDGGSRRRCIDRISSHTKYDYQLSAEVVDLYLIENNLKKKRYSKDNYAELIEYAKQLPDMTDKELVRDLCDQFGYTKSYCYNLMRYINFAKAWEAFPGQ